MAKILIVEDDVALSGNLAQWLEDHGYSVETASTGEDGLFMVKESIFDAIVLDWELPGLMDGFAVCREIRNRRIVTPIIFLTGRSTLIDKVLALETGADEYITKPFSVQEFAARLKAILRRPTVYLGNVIEAGGIVLDSDGKSALVKGKSVVLRPLEFALLEFLMRHKNIPFTAQALLTRVWPSDAEASLSAVRTLIKHLRRKLSPDDPIQSPIKNSRGGGYKFETETPDKAETL